MNDVLILPQMKSSNDFFFQAAPVVQPPQNEDAEAQEEVWAEQKETNLSEVWKESDPAERLAHWNEKENDASSPLMGNGRAHGN